MKRIKYLGINLPKGIKGHKTIKHWLYYMKKSKMTQIDGKIHHVHGLE